MVTDGSPRLWAVDKRKVDDLLYQNTTKVRGCSRKETERVEEEGERGKKRLKILEISFIKVISINTYIYVDIQVSCMYALHTGAIFLGYLVEIT